MGKFCYIFFLFVSNGLASNNLCDNAQKKNFARENLFIQITFINCEVIIIFLNSFHLNMVCIKVGKKI
jgi:hypothetical protein